MKWILLCLALTGCFQLASPRYHRGDFVYHKLDPRYKLIVVGVDCGVASCNYLVKWSSMRDPDKVSEVELEPWQEPVTRP